MSMLPTIVKSLEVKVHYLRSNSEQDDLSDSENASDGLRTEPTVYDKTPSKFNGARNSDFQSRNSCQSPHKIDDGDIKDADDYVEFVYPTNETISEETVRASAWPASTHGTQISNFVGDLAASETPSWISILDSEFKGTPQSVSVGFCSS